MQYRPVGNGVDLVELESVRTIRYKDRFVEYFLNADEIDAMPPHAQDQYIASRFALKEAVIKAFPTKLKPHEFSIGKIDEKPAVSFTDSSREDEYAVLASISHTARAAIAFAVVLKKI